MKETILTKLSWEFAKKYRITLILWVALLLFGFLTYTSILKKEGFPPVALPIATIQGTYFVEDVNQVDNEVVVPITQNLESFETVESFTTNATPNTYSIIIRLQEEASLDDAVKEIEGSLSSLEVLPETATFTVTAVDATKFRNKYDLIFALYKDENTPYTELQRIASSAANTIASEDAIIAADVLNVIEDVTNPQTGSSSARQTSVNKIGIRQNNTLTFYRSVSIGVQRSSDIDDIVLFDRVDEFIATGQIPNAKAQITSDFARTIDQQITSLQSNLLGGLIAVLVVTFLLISWRAAIVIALFIPTVMAASFLGLSALQYTLNTITLFSLILTLGLFVDDATIIVESIDAHRNDKSSHKNIISSSIRRVGVASIAGSLTTMLVFTPMLLVSGILGEFIRLLPITVILALTFSLFISLVLIPFLARPVILAGTKRLRWLDRASVLVPVEQWLSQKLSNIILYRPVNKFKSIVVPLLLVGLSIASIAGAVYFASKLSFEIFPQSKDSNYLQTSIEFNEGITIEEVEQLTDNLDNQIVESIGPFIQNIVYISANNRSALLQIELTDYQQRGPTSHNLIDILESNVKVDNTTLKFTQRDAGPPTEDYPFQMRVYANNPEALQKASDDISSFLAKQKFNIGGEDISVAEVKTDQNDIIHRSERGRFVTISARFTGDNTASPAVIQTQNAVKNFYTEDKLSELNLNSNALDLEVGQENENAESFNSLGYGLIAALILMYILLVWLFNSFSQPLLILIAIPFSLFGVFFGLWLTDNPLSFFVMLGLLGLIGIVVNNTILLVEYTNQERSLGITGKEAIAGAIKDRFRPLITTTLTTVVALLPLALTDPFWQPLAYTLVFGLLSSLILILLAFPYYYLAFESIREWKNKRFPSLS